jgi:hypothetical protein
MERWAGRPITSRQEPPQRLPYQEPAGLTVSTAGGKVLRVWRNQRSYFPISPGYRRIVNVW